MGLISRVSSRTYRGEIMSKSLKELYFKQQKYRNHKIPKQEQPPPKKPKYPEDNNPQNLSPLSRSIALNQNKDNSPLSKQKEPLEVDSEDEIGPYLPAVYGCRSVEEFEITNKIEEGTFGVVYRAKEKKTKEMVALKKL